MHSVKRRGGSVVIGFHFVCGNEKGVTRNSDGTAWMRTWAVAERHAEWALKISSYVALHSSRSQLSYLQGVITGFRLAKRVGAKTENGIDFLVKLTDEPLTWVGDGPGEKGYAWGRAPSN